MTELLVTHPDIARRTAQRWVSEWVKDGLIAAVGKTRGRRYVPAAGAGASPAASVAGFSAHASPDAGNRGALRHPAPWSGAWEPAGYESGTLAAYRPNDTFYLADALRGQLHTLGYTGQRNLGAGTYARAILGRLSIDLSWASSRLEGNTYSLVETRELLESGKSAEDKAPVETQTILNHRAAIELLVENAGAAAFDRYTLLNLHGILSENLLRDPAEEGRLRQAGGATGDTASQTESSPRRLEEVLDAVLEKASRIMDPFEQSFFAMVHLHRMRPFADVNKRTSRLMANLPLIRANLCPLTFVGVLEADYNRAVLGLYETSDLEPLREFYHRAYERSTREYLAGRGKPAEPDPARLQYRDAIRQAVQDVVKYREDEPADRIRRSLAAHFANLDRAMPPDLAELVVAELDRLHEGVLARYGLRPAQYSLWRERCKRIASP